MLRYTAAKRYIIFSAYFIISEGFKMLKRTNFQLRMYMGPTCIGSKKKIQQTGMAVGMHPIASIQPPLSGW